MKKLFVLGMGLWILSGCATGGERAVRAQEESYKRVVQSWVGQSEQALVATWGMPDSVYPMDGGQKVVSYRKSRTVNGLGAATPGGLVLPSPETNFSCTTEFTIYRGVVTGWHSKGNYCRA